MRKTDDLRITLVRPLLPPAILVEEIPVSERASEVVTGTRQAVADALEGQDPRLVVVVGPVFDSRSGSGARICQAARPAAGSAIRIT